MEMVGPEMPDPLARLYVHEVTRVTSDVKMRALGGFCPFQSRGSERIWFCVFARCKCIASFMHICTTTRQLQKRRCAWFSLDFCTRQTPQRRPANESSITVRLGICLFVSRPLIQ